MSLAEYPLDLKKLIDATTDEMTLKQWKAQLEGDPEKAGKRIRPASGTFPCMKQLRNRNPKKRRHSELQHH